MAETSFEFALERMFAETPARPDADLFAALVMGRLNRGWTARRMLIGTMGAVGGLVGAVQIVGSDAIGHLQAFSARSNAFLAEHVAAPSAIAPGGLGIDSQVIWMAGALAIVGIGFGLARLVREI